MKIFFSVTSFILAAMGLFCMIFCTFDRNILRAAKTFFVFNITIFGLLLLLKAPLFAIINILIFSIITGLIIILARFTDAKNAPGGVKNGFLFNLKTLVAPFLGVIIVFSVVPFAIMDFNNYKIQEAQRFLECLNSLFINNGFSIILLLILIIGSIVGISTICGLKGIYKNLRGENGKFFN